MIIYLISVVCKRGEHLISINVCHHARGFCFFLFSLWLFLFLMFSLTI